MIASMRRGQRKGKGQSARSCRLLGNLAGRNMRRIQRGVSICKGKRRKSQGSWIWEL
jgi:hypothetical protein